MSTYKQCKRNLSGHKGHYTIVFKSFNALLNQEPPPSSEAAQRSYAKLQDRYDKIFASIDACSIALDSDGTVTDDVKEKKEKEILDYTEQVLAEQNSVETVYSTFKIKIDETTPIVAAAAPILIKPHVKLRDLSVPKWNGVQSDFYTRKTKLQHIMSEANVVDEMTQLCYVQEPNVLPQEYQTLISDCMTMREV